MVYHWTHAAKAVDEIVGLVEHDVVVAGVVAAVQAALVEVVDDEEGPLVDQGEGALLRERLALVQVPVGRDELRGDQEERGDENETC